MDEARGSVLEVSMSPLGEGGLLWAWNRTVAFLVDLGWMKHFWNDTWSSSVIALSSIRGKGKWGAGLSPRDTSPVP